MQRVDLAKRKEKDSLEGRAWRNLGDTYRTVYSYINSDLRPYGLTPPQYTVMLFIGKADSQSLTMSEIGNKMVVTFANITTIVDNLEKQEYVRRVRDSVDRRCIKVELTSAGSKIFEKIHDSHVREMESVMRVLNEHELSNLIRYMDKLKKRTIVKKT